MANGTQNKGRNNRANPALAGRVDEKGKQVPKQLQNLSEKEMSDQIKTILSYASDTLHFSAGDKEKVREAIRTFNDSTITFTGSDVNVSIDSATALFNLMHSTVRADAKVGAYKVEDYQDGAKLVDIVKKFAAAYQTAQAVNEMERASLNAEISKLYEQIRQIKVNYLSEIATLNSEHESDITALNAAHLVELENERAHHSAQLRDRDEQIRQIKVDAREKNRENGATIAKKIATMNAAHNVELENERARHSAELSARDAAYDAAKAAQAVELENERAHYSAQLRDRDEAYDAALAAEVNRGATAVYNEKKKKNLFAALAVALAVTTVGGAIGTGVGFSVAGAQRRRAESAEAKYQTLESEYERLDALFNDVINVLENNKYNVNDKANVDDIVQSIIDGKGGADANSIYQDIVNQFAALGIDLDALKDENGDFNKDAVKGKLGEIVAQYIENASVVTYWTNTMNDVLGKIQKKDSFGAPMVDEAGNKVGYSLNDFNSFEDAWNFVNNTFAQKVELILNQIPKDDASGYAFTFDNRAVATDHYSLSDFESVSDAIDFIGDLAIRYAESGDNAKYEALKQSFDQLSSDYNTLKENNDRSQKELQAVKDINKLLEGQNDALETRNAELQGQIAELQDEVKAKDALIAQKDGEISELNSEVSGLRSDLATATAEKTQAEQKLSAIQDELTDAEAARDQYKTAAEEWQKKADENQQNAEKAQALADTYENLYKSVDDRVTELEAQLAQAQKDKETAGERVSSLESQLSTAQSELAQVQRDKTTAETQRDQAMQRAEQLQNQLNEYQNGAQANPSTPSTGNNNAQVGSGDTDPENNNENPGHGVGGPEENEDDRVSGR